MNNLYSRSNFYKTVSVDGVMQKDLLSSPFNSYIFKRPFTKYRLSYEDWMRPDLISKKIFGTYDYWWIILKVNPNLQDIWNDYVVQEEDEETYPDAYKISELIDIPSILDIQELFTYVKNELENV